MNRYKVEVRTDSVWIVEAHSKSEAEELALTPWRITGCRGGPHSSSVMKVTNLSDPVQLVADLACQLQWHAFDEDGICKLCGASGLINHAKDCVLGRARHFLDAEKLPKPHICPTCGLAISVEREWRGE